MAIIDNGRQLEVSPSIDERAIDHFAEKQIGNVKPEPDLEHLALSGALKTAREEAQALVNLHNAVLADASQPRAAAVIQVAAAAQKTAERVAAKLLAANQKADMTISGIEKATFAPEGGSPLDLEIRAALKSMTPAERTKALGEAFEANDLSIIGSVLRAPGLLTGMPAAELEALRHRFREQHFPAEMKRLERLKKMRAASDVAGNAFVRLVKQAADTTNASGAIAARTKRESALAAHQQAGA